MQVSKDQKYIALLTGIIKIKEQEELKQIIVFEVTDKVDQKYKLILDHYLTPEYSGYSKAFSFNVRKDRSTDRSLILLSKS